VDKKGVGLLYFSVAGFLIAIAFFFGGIGGQTPGGETDYLGENEIILFSAYQTGEQQLFYS